MNQELERWIDETLPAPTAAEMERNSMITTDQVKLLAYMSPPTSLEDAAARISNLAEGGFEGMIGMKFISLEQLRMAMSEVGTPVAFQLSKTWSSPIVRLYETDFNDREGKKWWILAREFMDSGIDIVQVVGD